MKTIQHADFVGLIDKENFSGYIGNAIAHARELIVKEEGLSGIS